MKRIDYSYKFFSNHSLILDLVSNRHSNLARALLEKLWVCLGQKRGFLGCIKRTILF